ncbi:MAG: hypothetical protein Tsb002_24590 [Wenzhouxiangellaceae bacterium]
MVRQAAGQTYVRVSRAGCDRCLRGEGCGAGLFARLLKPEVFEIPVAGDHWQMGEWVAIRIPAHLLQAWALRLFGATAAAFLAGACGASLWPAAAAAWVFDLQVLLGGGIAAALTWRRFMPISEHLALTIEVSRLGARDRCSTV